MAKDFTARALPADRLRERWAYHNARVIAGMVLAAVIGGAAVLVVLDGHTEAGAMVALVGVSTVGAWTAYHCGAARAIARISFGDGR